MRYILFNNARESLLKKWVNGAIFSSHRTPPFLQTSTCKNSRWNGTQPHWTNIPSEIKVFNLPVNGVSYLSGFKLHLPGEMRSCVRAWNDWEEGGFASLNCLWKPGGGRVGVLVRLLGLSVLKWASVSSSPWSRSLAWLPCCNSSLFSRVSLSYRLFLFFFFYSQTHHLKRKCFLPSLSVRSDTVGDDVTEAYRRRHPHMRRRWFNVLQLRTRKSLSTNRAWSSVCSKPGDG